MGKLTRFRKGQIPWNKGLKGICKANSGSFKKGDFAREKHPRWNGGRRETVNGYIMVNVPGHPKAYRNEVYEHIVVAEKKLGRYLEKGENVHHINGIKYDNRPENLVVCKTWAEHQEHHRKYKHYEEDNCPEPINVGDKIVIGKKIRICVACNKCNNLFWKLIDHGKVVYKYCKICRPRKS